MRLSGSERQDAFQGTQLVSDSPGLLAQSRASYSNDVLEPYWPQLEKLTRLITALLTLSTHFSSPPSAPVHASPRAPSTEVISPLVNPSVEGPGAAVTSTGGAAAFGHLCSQRERVAAASASGRAQLNILPPPLPHQEVNQTRALKQPPGSFQHWADPASLPSWHPSIHTPALVNRLFPPCEQRPRRRPSPSCGAWGFLIAGLNSRQQSSRFPKLTPP